MATQHALLFPHDGQNATVHMLAKSWWPTLLRGLAASAFGGVALAWPRLTVVTLILLFAAYVLADGFSALFAAIKGREHGVPTWWLTIIGLLGVAFAAVTFFWPGVTATLLMMLIGAYAILFGLILVVLSFRLKKLHDAPPH